MSSAAHHMPALRLSITASLARANKLDGAWWPYSTNVTQELEPLLEALSRRLGRIRGVLLNRSEWEPTPLDWIPCGNRRTKISWYGLQDADTAVVIGDNDKRVALLVIPPSAVVTSAIRAMDMASAARNELTGAQTLQAVGVTREVVASGGEQ
ncbi:MAG: DUF5994 family protein [Actinomycetota bacterium]|nr:DUF5994 family protein [Actinomycetota bacterium]